MKKTKLKIDYDYDFQLYGIVTNAREYKLAWSINKGLKINLVKQKDILIPMANQGDLTITNLLFETENSSLRLIGNRSVGSSDGGKANLIPELSNFTHFFVVRDEGDNFGSQELIRLLKAISVIDYLTLIEIDKLKNKDNLIF
ncbi:MAG: IPExxxVDY family protein [Bacteroidetes bacterium]|nr:IPExxxVDY family protein [Bacteroidota bacterium]MDA1119036.1 IPExxxVDY family protein [Bacteroidota bacterium]